MNSNKESIFNGVYKLKLFLDKIVIFEAKDETSEGKVKIGMRWWVILIATYK